MKSSQTQLTIQRDKKRRHKPPQAFEKSSKSRYLPRIRKNEGRDSILRILSQMTVLNSH